MQPPKNIFRLEKGLKLSYFVAHQMQIFPTQGGVQTPKNIYL